ncbi:MAG: transposase, partial [Candidatus Hydrogenedentes bacterium]|nr:transposase [Candidatus Hydrogenedentota bacterium]
MRLTMQERKCVTKAMGEQFRRARKKEKGEILDRLVEATGYTRSYASWLLRNHGRRVEV